MDEGADYASTLAPCVYRGLRPVPGPDPAQTRWGARAGSGPGTGEVLVERRDGLWSGGEMTETEE